MTDCCDSDTSPWASGVLYSSTTDKLSCWILPAPGITPNDSPAGEITPQVTKTKRYTAILDTQPTTALPTKPPHVAVHVAPRLVPTAADCNSPVRQTYLLRRKPLTPGLVSIWLVLGRSRATAQIKECGLVLQQLPYRFFDQALQVISSERGGGILSARGTFHGHDFKGNARKETLELGE